MTDRERWSRVSEAFARAAELEGSARAAFLDRLEAEDPELHREVVSLLEADRDAGAWLTARALPTPWTGTDGAGGAPEGGTGGDPALDPDVAARIGTSVGPFEIDGFLARGGMGAVFSAHRTRGGFEQHVAVKLLPRSVGGPDVLRRFQAERSILAGLDHPNIARLLDGGATEDGLPWFAMERVHGTSLTRHAREKALSLETRLRLLVQICETVDFAHRNLVVHRDLKPSNILVTEDGRPKLLDFGIARVLDREPGDDQEITRAGARVLTPAYASPEQVDGGPITTATDTYALGLLLFELVTGERPYPGKLTGAKLREAILTRTPPAPSEVAARTRVVPAGRLKGDLDLICGKALRKEPERRYPSAAALAEDIRSFLAGRPVGARPDTTAYRLERWVRRNRALSAVSAAALITVVAGTVLYTTNLRAERNRARIQEERATAALGFVTDLFRASDPSAERTDTVPVGTFLARGIEEIRGDEALEPQTRADLLRVLGDVVYNLGRVGQADSLLTEAVAIRSGLLSDAERAADLDLAGMERLLGRMKILGGDLTSATTLLDRAAARQVRGLGATDEEVGLTLRALADALERSARNDSALVVARRAVDVLAVDPGTESESYARASVTLARMLDLLGRFAEARPIYTEARNALAASLGPESGPFLDATFNMADMERRAGNLEEAEALFRDLVEVEIGIYGERHHLVATDLNTLGALLVDQGRYDEAEELITRALDIRREVLGPEHYQVATSVGGLGRLAERRGDLAGAAARYREALRISRVDLGEDHRNRAISLINLAGVVARQGAYAEAEGLLERADAMIGRIQQGETQDWGYVQTSRAEFYEMLGRDDEALAVWERLVPFWRENLDPESARLIRAIRGLGMALSGVGRQPEAQAALEEAWEKAGAEDGAVSLQVEANLNLVRARRARAEGRTPVPTENGPARFQVWVDSAGRRFGPDDPNTALARGRLAEFEALLGEG